MSISGGMKLHIYGILLLIFCISFSSTAYSAVPSIEYLSSLSVTYPDRSAQDVSGNIYIVDTRKNTVHKFDKYGNVIKTIKSISQPVAVASGANGEVYIASSYGVYTLNPAGEVSLFITGSDVGSPIDMAVDSAGYLYVVDSASRSVKVFTNSGSYTSAFGDSLSLVTDLDLDGIADGCSTCFPSSIDIMYDDANNVDKIRVGYSVELLAADNNNVMIVTFDISGSPLDYMGKPFKSANMEILPTGDELVKVNGLATDSNGRIYIVDNYAKRLVVLSEEGALLTSLSFENIPNNVMADRFGRLFVSTLNGQVDIYSIDSQDVPNAVPTAPYFISPVGGDVVKTKTPTLTAGNSTDVNLGTMTYEFEVSANLAMTDPVWKISNVAEGGNGQTSTSSETPLQEDTKYFWRVRSFDGKDYSPYSQVTYFLVNSENSAPVIDTFSPLSAMLQLDIGSSVGFSVTGHDADTDKIVTEWYVDGQLVLTNENVFEFIAQAGDAGLHSIEVRLSDSKAYASQTWAVTVYRENTAPVAPVALAPVDGVDVDQLKPELTIQNSAADREGDSLIYTFEVSTVSDFTNIVASDVKVAEGVDVTSSTVAVDLVENTLYYWRAKACEVPVEGSYVKDYYCSAPSATATFFVNTVNDKSTAPGISSPANDTEVTILTPVLTVTASSDADINNTLTYEFDIATDSDFLNIVSGVTGVQEGGGSVSWTVDVELNDNTIYYWRSRALDSGNLYSEYRIALFFVNTVNDAPTAPLGLSPASGVEILTTLPVLTAVNGIDPDRDLLVYTFEVDRVDTFDSADLQRSSLLLEGMENTSWTVSNSLLENNLYYWRVKSSDGSAESPWSSTGTFFVNLINEAPSVPVLMTPLDGVAVNVFNPELALYDASDPEGDTLSYIYEIAYDPAFVFPVAESGPVGNRWVVVDSLTENEFYYWRAKAVDEHGLEGDLSQPGSFKVNIANDPPMAPVIHWQSFLPAENVVLEIVDSFDADGDALVYDIEIYSDMSLKNTVIEEKGIPEMSEKTIHDVGLLEKGTYYWRARAFDGTVYGSWSGIRMIIINESAVNLNPRTHKAYGRKRF